MSLAGDRTVVETMTFQNVADNWLSGMKRDRASDCWSTGDELTVGDLRGDRLGRPTESERDGPHHVSGVAVPSVVERTGADCTGCLSEGYV